MAQTARQQAAPVAEALSAEEQAQLDQMRVDDAAQPEPAAEPAVQPVEPAEPGAEPGEPATAAQQRQQMVPHAALHEERERRKGAEERARVLEERTNLILQRLNQPAATATEPAAATTAIPELDKDPLGHLVGLLKQQEQTIATLTQGQQQTWQQQQNAQAIAQLQNEAVGAEQEYRRTTPDYDAAVNFLRDQRVRELELAGFSPGDRANLIAQEALGIVARARQQGRNPAEMIYELSKLRGYQTAAPANGAAEPAAAAAAAANAGQRIQNAVAGQQQARSLGQVRGSPPVPMTAQALLEMTDDQFEKALATTEGKELLGV